MNVRTTFNALSCAVLVLACALLLPVPPALAASGITFSAVSHDFGNVAPGSSASFGVELANNSSSAFDFSLTLTGPSNFVQNNNCGASVAAGAECEIVFVYTSTGAGAQSATWSLAPNGETFSPSNGGTLTANGSSAAGFTLSTAEHNFGTQRAGTISAVYGTVLSNTTADPIALTIETKPAQYRDFPFVQNNCPATLAANTSCNLQWVFGPRQKGNFQTTFSITGVDTTTNQTVILTSGGSEVRGVTLIGEGFTYWGVQLTRAAYDFGEQGLNTASAVFGVQLTNATEQTITLTYGSNGNLSSFPQTASNCGASLAPNQSCQMQWVFTPQTVGVLQAFYGINAELDGFPIPILSGGRLAKGVALSGTGLSGGITLTTAKHNYGPWVVGTTSGAYGVTLSNTTIVSVNLTYSYLSGSDSADFDLSASNCGATLLAGATCNLAWEFVPQATGPLSTVYTINATDASSGNPISVSSGGAVVSGVTLVGNALATAGVSLASAGYQFGEQAVGGKSQTYGTVLYNTTGATISLSYSYSDPTAAQNFTSVIDNCGATLATNSDCNLQWQFTPVTAGAITVTYDINATMDGSPVTITSGGNPVNGVTLDGTGVN
jgi:hypothetical protein